MSDLADEYESENQRYAVCQSIWERRDMEPNDKLISQLRERTCRKEFLGYGIRTADEYVRGVLDCVGTDGAIELGPAEQYGQLIRSAMADSRPETLLKEAANRLVQTHEDARPDELMTTSSSMEDYCKAIKVELPSRTLMVFEAVVTTPKKDRDGDVLRTEGAKVDPLMPTLWHHMLVMPVGRMLRVVHQSKRKLLVASTITDSPLGMDTAHLMEHGALRISHGFRPLKFEAIQTKEDEPPGFDVKEFEVMEMSTVTVPSNTDAVITAFSRGKLTQPAVKRWAEKLYDERPVVIAASSVPREAMVGSDTCELPQKLAASAQSYKVAPPPAQCEVCGDPGTKPVLDTIATELAEVGEDNRLAEQLAPHSLHLFCDQHAREPIKYASRTFAVEIAAQVALDSVKAGRVLSKRNETRLRDARDMADKLAAQLDDVLSQLKVDDEEAKDGSESTTTRADGQAKATPTAQKVAVNQEDVAAAVRKGVEEAKTRAKRR
jgi:HK97 family phage prohead protease